MLKEIKIQGKVMLVSKNSIKKLRKKLSEFEQFAKRMEMYDRRNQANRDDRTLSSGDTEVPVS